MAYEYDGFYARFDTASKRDGEALNGADFLTGDYFVIEIRIEDGKSVVWLVNKFGADLGFLNNDDSRRVQLSIARQQTVKALLSYIAYTSDPEPGHYWGEVAIVSYDPQYEEQLGQFCTKVSNKLKEGVRPVLELSSPDVKRLLEEPHWMVKENLPLPKFPLGTAVIKSHQSLLDKTIEQGRKGNIGCYIVSWAFIIAAVVGAFLAIRGLL